MRVIAGKFKGRRLLCPSGVRVRPTADAAKESIFNLLGDRVGGARALDVFAGVGALGIEALSRGALSVDFIERDAAALKYLAKNLESVGVADETGVLRGDALVWMKKLHAMSRVYDVAFVDPPYGRGLIGRALAGELERPLLREGAVMVVRHHAKEPVAPPGSRYGVESERRFGDTIVTLLTIRWR
jgi:16S rRNA (guanine966-N2)-methyltransferase